MITTYQHLLITPKKIGKKKKKIPAKLLAPKFPFMQSIIYFLKKIYAEADLSNLVATSYSTFKEGTHRVVAISSLPYETKTRIV